MESKPAQVADEPLLGKLLREIYLTSGLKMERFAKVLGYSDKTIYYHFGAVDLNTSILLKYDEALKNLGFPHVDIWRLISAKRKGEDIAPLLQRDQKEEWVMSDRAVPYERQNNQQEAADLLRRAADLLSKPQGPAPERDK